MKIDSLHPALKALLLIAILIGAMYLVPPLIIWISGKAGSGVVFFISIVLLIWGLPVVAGWAEGRRKGHTNAGILLPLFFSWIGLFIVGMLSDRKKAEAQTSKQTELLQKTLQAQQEQIEQLKMLANSRLETTNPLPVRIPAGHYLIAARGAELGYFLPATIKAMLASDQITLADHYLDERTNRWCEIIDHPEI